MSALTIWFVGYGFFIVETLNKRPENMTQKTDAIIVLTGGNHRIHTGLDLFARGLSHNLFISGVHASVSRQDILNIRRDKPEIPECCLTLGREATTTQENATEAKAWIDKQKQKGTPITSIRLVTSTYHMRRALLEFQRAIKNVTLIPHSVEQTDYTPSDLKFWALTFEEYNKIIYRKTAFMIHTILNKTSAQ